MACENDYEENVENLRKLFYLNNIVSFRIEQLSCSAGSSSGDNYMSVIKRVRIVGPQCANDDSMVTTTTTTTTAVNVHHNPCPLYTKCIETTTTTRKTTANTGETTVADDIQACSDNSINEITLILKRQIPSSSRRRLYRCDEAFTNEINAYKHMVPLLNRYSNDVFFPNCFYAGSDDYGELIVLEDLKQNGYCMHNRIVGLDLTYCKLVMQHLAKLHAASIAAKHMEHEIFLEKCKKLRDIVYNKEAEDFYRNIVENSVQEALNSLRQSNVDGCLTEPIRLIEQLHTKLFHHIQNCISNAKDSLSVICHGDLWVNNIMFNASANSTAATLMTNVCTCDTIRTPVRFFDLQAMRYTSPVFDILHFIYTSTKRDLREAYTATLLETYCLALTADLETKFPANSFANQLNALLDTFSLSNITAEYYKHVLYGLVISMWILPAVTFDSEHIPNLDMISETNTSGKDIKCTQMLTPEFHSRLKDVALEFYQNGYLNVTHKQAELVQSHATTLSKSRCN